MRRKKAGYILLALLVITGLAGTISGSISGKERKFAANLMKNTSTDVLKSINGLSKKQLDFKISKEQWSARECVYHIAASENDLWKWLETALKSPANPEKRSEIKFTDEQLIKILEDRTNKIKTTELFEPKNSPYKSIAEAVADFKQQRAQHIEYIKSTTEDLRDHVAETPYGWIDGYQLYLLIASHSNRYMQQIDEIKANAGFPNK
ncbi:MAG: DinB family protein [Bacteroidota bacterium]